MKKFLILNILLLIVLKSSFLNAEVIKLENITELDIKNQVFLLKDKTGKLKFENVINSNKFKKFTGKSLNFGYTKTVIWCRFSVEVPENSKHWFLEIDYHLHDKVYFYMPKGNEYEKIVRGDILPFHKREYIHHNLIFQLKDTPGKYTYFLRIQTTGSMTIPLKIWEERKLNDKNQVQYFWHGLFYGLMLIMLFYNFFIFLATFDKIYLHYVFMIFIITILSTILDGMGFRFLWPNNMWFNNGSAVFVPLADAFVFIFSRAYLKMKENTPKINIVMIIFIGIYFLEVALSIILPYSFLIKVAVLLQMLGIIFLIFVGIYYLYKKNRLAIYFVLAIGFMIIGVALTTLKNMAILPNNFITAWAFQIGIVLQVVLFSLGLADKLNVMKNKLHEMNINLEDKVKERTEKLKKANKKLLEIDKLKTNFFANISHEIRTPLTLILSPVESVLQGDSKKEVDKEFALNIQKNAVRLLRLVNNILDFSKIEEGKMTMKLMQLNIVDVVKDYAYIGKAPAETRNIDVSFKTSNENIPMYVDIEKSDKIGMNLFSNALKFTNDGGKIELIVREDEKYCYIDIKDTGIGIPPGKIDFIFDRFSQVDSSSTRKYEGTGIGLSLTKELVEMHGGSISVQSKYIDEYPDDHGTTFSVALLKGKAHFENKKGVEFVANRELSESVRDSRVSLGMKEFIDLHKNDSKHDIPAETNEAGFHGADHPLILVVEDNPDMRNFLKDLFEESYSVIFALNGKEGLEKANKLQPDLIVTDVMMPGMNGYQMTEVLKNDKKLKRIPVLMLTARADINHKIEGLEYGADDYLTKPFNSRELLVRVKKLLENHEYEKIIVQRNEEIEEELEIARLLQNKLLPDRVPEVEGYKTGVTYIPMDKIGGDFYDIKVNDKRIELLIADVSGHGLKGAFLSMITKIAFESLMERKSTVNVLKMINGIICTTTVKNNFVTSFYAILDREQNILRYSNAGHFPPFIYRKSSGEFIELKKGGTPLGWIKDIKLKENQIQLLSGDRLILFTDGITECRNNTGEEFGTESFMEYIKKNSELLPEDFSLKLLKHLRQYAGNEKFDDDLCLLVFDVV